MARTIRNYCNAHPVQRHHQKAGEKVAVSSPPLSVGWAWNPDEKTRKQIAAGNRRYRKAVLASKERELEETQMATSKSKTGKKASTKKTAKKVAKKVEKRSGLTPLKALCKTLRIDPRLARRVLRADKAMVKVHEAKGRWEFTEAQAKKAKAVLTA